MNHKFEFLRKPLTTPMDTELMLRRYGIPITGRCMGEVFKHGDGGKGDKVNRGDYGWFTLSVPAARAGWAEYLLYKWGYPPSSPLVKVTNANIQPGPMPPAWGVPAEAKTPMDWLLKIMCMVTSGAAWDLKTKRAKLGKTYQ